MSTSTLPKPRPKQAQDRKQQQHGILRSRDPSRNAGANLMSSIQPTAARSALSRTTTRRRAGNSAPTRTTTRRAGAYEIGWGDVGESVDAADPAVLGEDDVEANVGVGLLRGAGVGRPSNRSARRRGSVSLNASK